MRVFGQFRGFLKRGVGLVRSGVMAGLGAFLPAAVAVMPVVVGTVVAGAVLPVVGVLLPMSQEVRAEGEEATPDYRIQMSPSKIVIDSVKPGKTYEQKVSVQNTGTKPFNFVMEVAPYSVTDGEYAPQFTADTQYTMISNWVTYSQDRGTLEPNSSVDITATISVPSDVPAGGQYAALIAKVDTAGSAVEMGMSVTPQVGVVIYSTVDGKTRNGGEIVENKISGLLFKPPVTATSVIENTGNTHIEAEYILQVFPLFGDEEVYTNEEEPDKKTILPETRRFNTIAWEGAPQLGIFRVKQTVKIQGKSSVEEKLVFLCPIWFLFIILLLIFCIVFWVVSRAIARRKGE